tara:strand:- start:6024 stop:6128 length:105 start_codon:yes stop_codon:yes gene_type:complete
VRDWIKEDSLFIFKVLSNPKNNILLPLIIVTKDV